MNLSNEQYILVTGGAGFIGSGVIRYLNDEGFDQIIVTDDLGHSEKWKNLVGKRIAQYLHKDQLFDWLQGRAGDIQAIIHLGACSDTMQTDANYVMANNYQYTLRLAEYALEHAIRFIYASSAATYGDGTQGFSDQHEGISNLKPLNVYGYSKHLFDQWALQEGVLDQLVGLKYFNIFGPNEYHKGAMSSAVVHFSKQLKETGVLRLFRSSDPEGFADGEQRRDFLYVKDAVAMTCQFLTSSASGLFNVGSGKAHTWNELAEAVLEAWNIGGEIEYIPMPAKLEGKYQNYTCADMSKWQKESCAKWRLKDAVFDYVRNYLSKERYW